MNCSAFCLLMNNGVRRSDDSRMAFLTDMMKPMLMEGVGPTECWKFLIQILCKTGVDRVTRSRHKELLLCFLNAGAEYFHMRFVVCHEPFPMPDSPEWWEYHHELQISSLLFIIHTALNYTPIHTATVIISNTTYALSCRYTCALFPGSRGAHITYETLYPKVVVVVAAIDDVVVVVVAVVVAIDDVVVVVVVVVVAVMLRLW